MVALARPITVARSLVALATLVALAACQPSGGGSGPTAATIRGTASADGGGVLGAGLVLFDLSGLPVGPTGTAVATATWPVQAIDDGVWIAALTPTSSSGEFELVLPARSTLPAELFVPSASFMPTVAALLESGMGDCALTSTAATVMVTASAGGPAGLGPISTPAPFLLVDGEVTLAFTTTVAIQPGDDVSELPFVTWVYADGDVTVGVDGADCPPELEVDLPLRRGWNEVVWTFSEDAASIARRDPAPVFVRAFRP